MSEAPSIEQQATERGWRPKEEFKGHPDHFVDAETYLARSETVLPIVKKENENLRTELTSVRGQLSKVEQALAESQASQKEFAEFQSQLTADRVKAAKDKLLSELVAAKREGNVEDEVRLTDELTDLKATEQAALVEKKPPVERDTSTQDGANNPVFQQWIGENGWYLSDPEKQRAAIAYGMVLRADPATKGLVGRPFLDRIKQHIDKVYTGGTTTSVDRVEGGRPTGDYGGGNGGNGKSYHDLPAEAKEVVNRQASRFVGENKTFKDLKAWQDHYAKTFFAE